MTDPGGYRVEVAGPARRGLHRLPGRVAAAVIEFITGRLADKPARLSNSLSGKLTGLRSAPRGDYRVLIRVHEASRTVLVVRIDHRADLYRRR